MNWIINLDSLQNGKHEVETHDGAYRHGKITKINWRHKTICDRNVKEPSTIELNDDSSDYIEWNEIKSIRRVGD